MKTISTKAMKEYYTKHTTLSPEEISKHLSDDKKRINKILAKPLIKRMDIEVTYVRNRTWGWNPIAKVVAYYVNGEVGNYTFRASGAGYDKTQHALGQAMRELATQNLYARKSIPKGSNYTHGVDIAFGEPRFVTESGSIFRSYPVNTFWGKVTPLAHTENIEVYRVDFKVPNTPVTQLEGRKTNVPHHRKGPVRKMVGTTVPQNLSRMTGINDRKLSVEKVVGKLPNFDASFKRMA
jgi:hypothetical protein